MSRILIGMMVLAVVTTSGACAAGRAKRHSHSSHRQVSSRVVKNKGTSNNVPQRLRRIHAQGGAVLSPPEIVGEHGLKRIKHRGPRP